MIKVDAKRKFFKWIVNNESLKIRESIWVLNYIRNHEDILEHVRIVDNMSNVSRGIIMSTKDVEGYAFRYRRPPYETNDAEKAFHEIRLNKPSEENPLYLDIIFKDRFKNELYLDVLEENPYVNNEIELPQEDKVIATRLLDHVFGNFQQLKLKQDIDKALENKDEQEFLRLIGLLKSQK